LSRNISQADNFRCSNGNSVDQTKASSTSDLSGTVPVGATRNHVSGLPDPIDGRSQYVLNNYLKKSKKRASDASFLYKAPGGR